MCGYVEHPEWIAFPEQYNRSHCLYSENMTSLPECKEMFGKLFSDLLCVRQVKETFQTQHPSKHKKTCNCPEACDSFKFDTFYSLAGWPGDGPELDEAYRKIVLENIIPHFKSFYSMDDSGQNPKVVKDVIDYLSDRSKKTEIMRNFIRLTVYIKDLAVETIQDVVGYSEMDLLSDIG